MENKIKHLEMIQDVIKRMASNSFALKGWAVTIVAALFALSAKESNDLFFLVAFIPVLMFWFLDSYYLKQERLYRSLYDDVRKPQSTTDFSMAAKYEKYPEKRNRFWNCFKSPTELWFYFPLALVCGVVILLKHCIIVSAASAG